MKQRENLSVLSRVNAEIARSGIRGFMRALWGKILPKRIHSYRRWVRCVEAKSGLEIGGPSGIFSRGGLIPLYECIAALDNCNFGSETIWEGHISGGDTFQFSKSSARGCQYFAEATNLEIIHSEKYDFLLSSHVLEHVANPLKALAEWRRVIRTHGNLILILPDKNNTFDRHRSYTTMAHFFEDFERQVDESDRTHVSEILSMHDHSRDEEAGGVLQFRERVDRNINNRGLHHHVFSLESASMLLRHAGFEILDTAVAKPFHLAILAQKQN